jgi:uncharacterized protein YciI
MKYILASLILVSIFACQSKTAPAGNDPRSSTYDFTKDTTVYSNEMKRYWLVLLKAGPNRSQDKETAARIQAGHMANINRLASEGKIIMAGPMGRGSGDLQGIFIMDCKDSAEVDQMVRTDTAVMTGRLRMEYFPWWSAKGKFIFK